MSQRRTKNVKNISTKELAQLLPINLDHYLRDTERRFLEQYLQLCDGNKSRAAALLGMRRTTLEMRLRALGLKQWYTTRKELAS